MRTSSINDITCELIHQSYEVELQDILHEFKVSGLSSSVAIRHVGPQASLAWLIPTGAVIWFSDKYFGAMLQEAAKDHYAVVKRGLELLYHKTLGPTPTITNATVRMDGAVVPDNCFSGNLSFAYKSAEGWIVKLLFPLDITASQYDQSCSAFSLLIADHLKDTQHSSLEREIGRAAREKARGLPPELARQNMRERVRVLVFWNHAVSQFYVPDPITSGRNKSLSARPLGSEA